MALLKKQTVRGWLLAIAIGCALALPADTWLSAQEADPFGPPGADAGAKASKAAPKAAKKSAKAAPAGRVELPRPRTDYSIPVQTVIAGNPQTPRELMRAAVLLIDLGEPELAAPYLKQLAAAKLDQAALADLVRQIGSPVFMRLAAVKALAPDAQQFADRALTAAAQQARDPKRLTALVNQLADPSIGTQQASSTELLSAHQHAVGPLLAAAVDLKRPQLHAPAQALLLSLGAEAVDPLLAALDRAPFNNNAAARITVIDLLAALEARAAAPKLVGLYLSPVSPQNTEEVRQAAGEAIARIHGARPTLKEGIKFLRGEAEEIFSAERPIKTDVDGQVEMWLIANNLPGEASQGGLQSVAVYPPYSRAIQAARIAGDLYRIAPQEIAHRRLYLLTTLEAASYGAGLDAPLKTANPTAYAEAATLGVDAIDDALVQAMATNHAPAAVAAAQLLGELGKFDLLTRAGNQPSPLVQAVRHPDRRVRFAATEAIAKLRPEASFPGLGYVTDALLYFATSAGERRALVGYPNVEANQRLAGLLGAVGYQAESATNGRDLILTAVKNGDYELILIGSRIERTSLTVTLQELRREPKTKQIPVILLSEDDEQERLVYLANSDPLTTIALRPRDQQAMEFAVERALRLAGDAIVPVAVRQQQANSALLAMAELTARSPKLFDFRTHDTAIAKALWAPPLSNSAASLLSLLGTHESQRALVDLANRNGQPIPLRQAAAGAFCESVRRHGIQLTKDEIRRQYARYNQSETEERAIQELLTAMLDAMESK